MDSHLRNIKIDSPDQPSRHVTLLGHEPGVILKDELSEYRSMDAAQGVILHRYRTYSLRGLHRLMGLVDDCTLPDFFDGKEYEDRYLGRLLSMERLRPLALEHLGGDESYTVLALNRQAAANYTVMQALVPKGSVVPYVVPPYPGGVRRGHPSIPQAVELARSRWEVVSTVDELERFLDRDPNVPLVTVCPLYRGVVPEETLEAVCSVAQRRDVPVYMDDAAGARVRLLVYGQRRAIDMGADVVSTSCEKAAMHGPRASLIVGRAPLMMKIAAKANVLGTDARPSVVAAIVRALEEYSPGEAKVYYATLAHRHGHITELLSPVFGDSVSPEGIYGGAWVALDDFHRLVRERAGLAELDLAPVDLSVAMAMLMLRDHGFMTVPALHYPGASKLVQVSTAGLEDDPISDDEIASGVIDSFDRLGAIASDRSAVERILFEAPA